MPTFETLLLDITPPFAYLTLNRPQQGNALSFQMMGELVTAVREVNAIDDIRAIVVSGAGGNFSTGGDIGDLRAAQRMSANEQDAAVAQMDTILRLLNESPKVVIARVDGMALGGGFGLVCVADIAVSSTTATFGLPEVRLGIVPALIAPYVIQRIGITRARVLMLTGVRFDGVSAHEYGLVNEVCPAEILDECVSLYLNEIRQCSPAALAVCKRLIHETTRQSLDDSLPYRVKLLNILRASDEGQEGLSAALHKRPPRWSM